MLNFCICCKSSFLLIFAFPLCLVRLFPYISVTAGSWHLKIVTQAAREAVQKIRPLLIFLRAELPQFCGATRRLKNLGNKAVSKNLQRTKSCNILPQDLEILSRNWVELSWGYGARMRCLGSRSPLAFCFSNPCCVDIGTGTISDFQNWRWEMQLCMSGLNCHWKSTIQGKKFLKPTGLYINHRKKVCSVVKPQFIFVV